MRNGSRSRPTWSSDRREGADAVTRSGPDPMWPPGPPCAQGAVALLRPAFFTAAAALFPAEKTQPCELPPHGPGGATHWIARA